MKKTTLIIGIIFVSTLLFSQSVDWEQKYNELKSEYEKTLEVLQVATQKIGSYELVLDQIQKSSSQKDQLTKQLIQEVQKSETIEEVRVVLKKYIKEK